MATADTDTVRPGNDRQEKARQYSKETFRLALLSFGADLAVLLILVLTPASRWIGSHTLPHASAGLHVLLYAVALGVLLKLVGLPFSLESRRIEMRYALDRQSWISWLWDEVKGALLGGAIGLAGVELVYWLLRSTPQRWWLWTWLAFAVFAVVLAQLAPVVLLPLFYKFRPLQQDGSEAELARRLSQLCDRAGARVRGVFEWKLGEKSAKANAALTGWGATRRVILSDTLLTTATADEIEAVFAHELGHHVHRHIWAGLAFQGALSFFGFWLANAALRFFAPRLQLAGIADIAGLPLLLLVATVLSLLLLPVGNGFMRRMERQADDYAFRTVGTVEPLVTALERLGDQNLSERNPPRWKEFIFYSHPSLATRIARARAWAAARETQR